MDMKNTLHIVYIFIYIYIHVGSIESPNSYTYTTKQRCRYSHSHGWHEIHKISTKLRRKPEATHRVEAMRKHQKPRWMVR